MARLLTRRPDVLPSLAVALSAVFWGVFWIPLRALDGIGFEGRWAAFAFFVFSFLFLAPIAILRWDRLLKAGPGLVVTGLASGGAFVLYMNSLVTTEVVRALLLFYLTPVWSTILGRLILKEPFTLNRLLTVTLGLMGALVILGVRDGFPLPRNAGDTMSLLAGICWAYGSTRIRAGTQIKAFESTFAFFAWGAVLALALALLPIGGSFTLGSLGTVAGSIPWIVLLVIVFIIPANFLIVWGAGRLSPGRVGILLMLELIVGTASAAVLTGEPFGLREIIGVCLVGAAATLEVLRSQPSHPDRCRAQA